MSFHEIFASRDFFHSLACNIFLTLYLILTEIFLKSSREVYFEVSPEISIGVPPETSLRRFFPVFVMGALSEFFFLNFPWTFFLKIFFPDCFLGFLQELLLIFLIQIVP